MKMAGGVEEAGFWLPSEFLTDDDFLMDKENFNNTESDSEFCFPTEFPYDFETQTNKFWVMSTSPQSTLAHLGSAGGSSNGSPNGAPSPSATPLGAKYDAVGDLIYLAAGQVAKLKLNRDYMMGSGFSASNHAQFNTQAKTPIPSVYLNAHFQQKQQNDGYGVLYTRQQMYQNRGGMGQTAAWTLQQNPTRGRAVSFVGPGGGGGATAKRTCAGTGVFLPRRYDNISNGSSFSSDAQRKPGRAGIQVHTRNFSNMNVVARSQPQPQPQPRIDVPDYYSLLARRHALLLQQRRSLLTSLAEGSSMMGRDLY